MLHRKKTSTIYFLRIENSILLIIRKTYPFQLASSIKLKEKEEDEEEEKTEIIL